MDFQQAVRAIDKGARIIRPSMSKLTSMAMKEGKATRQGSLAFYSSVTGRSAKETEVIFGKPSREQKEVAQKVAEHLHGKEMVRIERRIGRKSRFLCRAYVPPDYSHTALLWASTLFPIPKGKGRIDFTTIVVPDWPDRRVLTDVERGITFILGSDYAGELKMANLRLAMYRTKQRGGLGLHAGSKLIRVRDAGGRLRRKGVLLFGLSASGKTTLTCHGHGLDGRKGEGIVIRQDDIVLMQKDASCPGTERNFYVKTDSLDDRREPLVHKAALRADALLENVIVRGDGEPDFLDTSKTSNGRAVIQRRFMDSTDGSIDLDRADIILFITRRDTIVPPVAKLSAEQAGAFFMLGESMGSSASDLDPGKPKRVVGMNPFVVGPGHIEGNRFYDLMRKNPHIECFLLNTGSVGRGGMGKPEKIKVQDSAAIIREIARGSVEWKEDPDWGYLVIDRCEGVDASKFHPERHYTRERYSAMTEELREDRREWLAGFPKLDKRIRDAI